MEIRELQADILIVGGGIGGFAAALSRGDSPEVAARFGSATAGISVTRPGTAPSMPMREETEALLRRA